MSAATAVAFSIRDGSPTAPPVGRVGAPSLILGTVVAFFAGAVPVTASQVLSPSALTPISSAVQAAMEQRSYRPSKEIEQSIARLRMFGAYEDDWDDRGARRPNQAAINAALEYLTYLEAWHPSPLATMSRDGEPILEFQDETGALGSIRFIDGKTVELYSKSPGAPSAFIEGDINSNALSAFLSNTMNLPTL